MRTRVDASHGPEKTSICTQSASPQALAARAHLADELRDVALADVRVLGHREADLQRREAAGPRQQAMRGPVVRLFSAPGEAHKDIGFMP